MLGSHDASEAYPLVDAGRSRKNRRKGKIKGNEDPPQSRSLEAQKLMDQSPWSTVRIRISHYYGDLAVTYAETTISDKNSLKKVLCWRSWSAVIPQINRRNLKNPFKRNILQNYKKKYLRTLENVLRKKSWEFTKGRRCLLLVKFAKFQ